MEDWTEESAFEEENEAYESITKMSGQYRLQKLLAWLVRTAIAAFLFIYFWEHTWVKWLLILYIPLNIFGLYSVLKSANEIDAKIEEVIEEIEEYEAALAAEEEE
jgi:hypothetical protein